MDNKYPHYDGAPIPALAEAMVDLRQTHDEIKAQAAEVWREHEYLAKTLIPALMEDQGIGSMVIKGLGRLEIRHEASCSIPPENKDDVYEWMRENGYGDLIVGTINASTFKAQVKRFVKEGEDFPMDLIKFNPYENAVLVKAK